MAFSDLPQYAVGRVLPDMVKTALAPLWKICESPDAHIHVTNLEALKQLLTDAVDRAEVLAKDRAGSHLPGN